jgi:hypothetical protein
MERRFYKTSKLWMSRRYVRSGNIVRYIGSCFFNSDEEYDGLAIEHGWNNDQATGTSWCTKPVPVDVVTDVRYLRTLSS